jgi:uncharacterized protein YqjF (DUF2071 family)
MTHSLQRLLGAAIGAAATTFIDAAGQVLEADRLAPDDHRPWPIPRNPWAMTQRWEHVLFAHWPVEATAVGRLLPAGLRLETFRGRAWLGITAFAVTGARLRGLPAVPGFSEFAEVNVRTYVTAGRKPGIYFFSLDAGSVPTVLGGWAWYALPYFLANARVGNRGNAIRFTSRREHAGAPPAAFSAEYRPTARVPAGSGRTLARWLTERYCAYTTSDGRVLRTEIHHPPWPLQTADVVIRENTLAQAAGLEIVGPPRFVHYATAIDAVVWAPQLL